MAHGNICRVEFGSSGATRRTSINGRHIEQGKWTTSNKMKRLTLILTLTAACIAHADDTQDVDEIVAIDYNGDYRAFAIAAFSDLADTLLELKELKKRQATATTSTTHCDHEKIISAIKDVEVRAAYPNNPAMQRYLSQNPRYIKTYLPPVRRY